MNTLIDVMVPQLPEPKRMMNATFCDKGGLYLAGVIKLFRWIDPFGLFREPQGDSKGLYQKKKRESVKKQEI